MTGSAPQHQKTKPIAILSDVHANLPAFERALGQIAKHDVARIVCAGDLVGYGPEPNQVLDLVLEAKVECIWGNHDRWTLREPHKPNAFGGALLDARHVKTLEALPESLSFVHQGARISVVHGAPQDDMLWIKAHEMNEAVLADFLEQMDCDVLVFGHTHEPALIEVPGRGHLINPGMVLGDKSADGRYGLNGTWGLLRVEPFSFEVFSIADGAVVPVGIERAETGIG